MSLPVYFQLPLRLLCFLVLFLVLSVPDSLLQLDASALLVVPLELLVLGLILLMPGTTGRCLRWLAAALLAVRTVFVLADTVSYQTFARPFNPIFDAYLLADAMNLLSGVLGKLAALGIAIFSIALLVLIIGCVFWLLEKVRETLLLLMKPLLPQKPSLVQSKPQTALAAAVLLGLSVAGLGLADLPYISQRFSRHLVQHAHNIRSSLVDMREFRELLARQSVAQESVVFEELQGRDILVIFIESYGRSLLDKPEFAEHFRPFLADEENKLNASGIGVRSGYLRSPTVGGLSWFAHATAMSGLWIDSQVRYDSLILSDHHSLNRLFRNAGWRTVAVMPAITMAWPEAEYFGYDHIYHARNSGYAGKPFNWITMPDQYTLAAFHGREIEPAVRKPVMAEIALISSHAPWTPVPTLVDWESIGDGRIFDDQAEAGDSPEEVWRDPERIRLQYRLSVEYSLRTLIDYLVKHAGDNTLVIALGDHQPAPLVTGITDNREVPAHFFSRDQELLNAIADWEWTPGLMPDTNKSAWRMSELRAQLINAFSTL